MNVWNNPFKIIKFLVVDDEEFWIQVIPKFLKMIVSFKSDVFIAKNASEAFDIIKKQPIHVVICDYNLPDMKGTEILNKIRFFNSQILRIMITGYKIPELSASTLKKYQINHFLEKPPVPEIIERIVINNFVDEPLVLG